MSTLILVRVNIPEYRDSFQRILKYFYGMKKILLLLLLLPILSYSQSNLKEMSKEQLLLQKSQAIESKDDERLAAIDYELNSRMSLDELQLKFNSDLEAAISIEDYGEAARIKKIIQKLSEVRSIDSSIQRAVDQQDFNRAEELKKERDRIKEEVYQGTYPLKNDNNTGSDKKFGTDKIQGNSSSNKAGGESPSKASNATVVFITALPELHVIVDDKYYGIATKNRPLIIHDVPVGKHTYEVYESLIKHMKAEVFTVAQTEVVEYTFNVTPVLIRSGLKREQDNYNYPNTVVHIKNGIPSVDNYTKIDYQTPINITPVQTNEKSTLVRSAIYLSGEAFGSPKFTPFYLGICAPFNPSTHLLLEIRMRFAGIKYVGFSEAFQIGLGYGHDIRRFSVYGLLNGGGNMLIFNNNNYDTRYNLEAQIHFGARYYFPISSTSNIGIYGEGNLGLYHTPSGFSIGIAFSGN